MAAGTWVTLRNGEQWPTTASTGQAVPSLQCSARTHARMHCSRMEERMGEVVHLPSYGGWWPRLVGRKALLPVHDGLRAAATAEQRARQLANLIDHFFPFIYGARKMATRPAKILLGGYLASAA